MKIKKKQLLKFACLFSALYDASYALSDPDWKPDKDEYDRILENVKIYNDSLNELPLSGSILIKVIDEIEYNLYNLSEGRETYIREIIKTFVGNNEFLDITAEYRYSNPELINPNLDYYQSNENFFYQSTLGALKVISRFNQKQVSLETASILERYIILCYMNYTAFIIHFDAKCLTFGFNLAYIQEQMNIVLMKRRPIGILLYMGYESFIKDFPEYKKFQIITKAKRDWKDYFWLTCDTIKIEDKIPTSPSSYNHHPDLYSISDIIKEILYLTDKKHNYIFDFIRKKIEFSLKNELLDLFRSELTIIESRLSNFNSELIESIKYELNRFNTYYVNCELIEIVSNEPDFITRLVSEQRIWIELFLCHFTMQKEPSYYSEILKYDRESLLDLGDNWIEIFDNHMDDYIKFPNFSELIECIRTIVYYHMVFDLYHQELKEVSNAEVKENPLIFTEAFLNSFYAVFNDFLWKDTKIELFKNWFRLTPIGQPDFKDDMQTYFCYALGKIEKKRDTTLCPNFEKWIKPLINYSNYCTLKARTKTKKNPIIKEIDDKLSLLPAI